MSFVKGVRAFVEGKLLRANKGMRMANNSRIEAGVQDIDSFMACNDNPFRFPVELVVYLSVLADDLIRMTTGTCFPEPISNNYPILTSDKVYYWCKIHWLKGMI